MKIIIVGCGKFGTRLANYLNNQNHDVTIIDNREEAFNNLGGNFTGRTVLGMGYDKDVLEKKSEELGKLEAQLKEQIDAKIVELEKIAAMSANEAKEELFKLVEQKMSKEVTAFIKEQEDEAKSKASLYAKDIIAAAINRYSQEETIERTVNVEALTSEEMKGRIIGREGRNIKAIENATGVELIIDDTPEAITIFCIKRSF